MTPEVGAAGTGARRPEASAQDGLELTGEYFRGCGEVQDGNLIAT